MNEYDDYITKQIHRLNIILFAYVRYVCVTDLETMSDLNVFAPKNSL